MLYAKSVVRITNIKSAINNGTSEHNPNLGRIRGQKGEILMSKSILVIDTPDNCKECQLCKNYKIVQHAFGRSNTHEVHCSGINNLVLKETDKSKRPDWCPLKEIPQKLAEENRWFSKDYAVGFNACVDEILGERD